MPQQIMFYIAEKVNGKWVRDEGTGNADARNLEPLVARRNTRAKEMGLQARYKIERVVTDVVDWRTREALRIKDGTYKPLPASWKAIRISLPDHFCHLTDKPGYVAYTPDETAGNQDKQMVVLAGTYLRKYWKGLSDENIDDLREAVGDTDGILTVHMTNDGEEIAAVYMHGGPGGPTNSCMSYGINHWPNKRHPCSFYGKPGNLALAYTMTKPKRTDPDCTVTARTIVNTELKVWGRTYGFSRDVMRIERWLKSQGYTQAGIGKADKPEKWVGSTFKTEPFKAGVTTKYYTPHIDFCHVMHLDPKTHMFRLYGKGETIPAGHRPYTVYTNTVWAIAVETCDNCNQGRREFRTVAIYDEKGEAVSQKWCRHCCMTHPAFTSCVLCAVYTNKTTKVPFDGGDTYQLCPACAEHYRRCHECSIGLREGEANAVCKYTKEGKPRKVVDTCRACYKGLVNKYRKWGNPNF